MSRQIICVLFKVNSFIRQKSKVIGKLKDSTVVKYCKHILIPEMRIFYSIFYSHRHRCVQGNN